MKKDKKKEHVVLSAKTLKVEVKTTGNNPKKKGK
jgi:hypothetical protein